LRREIAIGWPNAQVNAERDVHNDSTKQREDPDENALGNLLPTGQSGVCHHAIHDACLEQYNGGSCY
jgi:hypothetical protein